MHISSIGQDTRLFQSNLVDFQKLVDNGYRYKGRLVAQNYGDKQAATIATNVPTIQCFKQRPDLALEASMDESRPT